MYRKHVCGYRNSLLLCILCIKRTIRRACQIFFDIIICPTMETFITRTCLKCCRLSGFQVSKQGSELNFFLFLTPELHMVKCPAQGSLRAYINICVLPHNSVHMNRGEFNAHLYTFHKIQIDILHWQAISIKRRDRSTD